MIAAHAAYLLIDIFVYVMLLSIIKEVLLAFVAYHAYMALSQTTVYGYVVCLFICSALSFMSLSDYLTGWGWFLFPA